MRKLRVQREKCETCIFGRSVLELGPLLDEVRDPHVRGYFRSWRVCHHSRDAVCQGFWEAYKDKFDVGQVAQRLNLVKYVSDDITREKD